MMATSDRNTHRRGSIRLHGYDYSQHGIYFITICTQDHLNLFGKIANGAMHENEAGMMVRSVWEDLPSFYPGTETDEFVVMPNHVHGIVAVVKTAPDGHSDSGGPSAQVRGLSLPDIVHRYKTLTTKRYSDAVEQLQWPRYPGRLWQRNYYEHIVRDESSLNQFRQYILDNPAQWADDHELGPASRR